MITRKIPGERERVRCSTASRQAEIDTVIRMDSTITSSTAPATASEFWEGSVREASNVTGSFWMITGRAHDERPCDVLLWDQETEGRMNEQKKQNPPHMATCASYAWPRIQRDSILDSFRAGSVSHYCCHQSRRRSHSRRHYLQDRLR